MAPSRSPSLRVDPVQGVRASRWARRGAIIFTRRTQVPAPACSGSISMESASMSMSLIPRPRVSDGTGRASPSRYEQPHPQSLTSMTMRVPVRSPP